MTLASIGSPPGERDVSADVPVGSTKILQRLRQPYTLVPQTLARGYSAADLAAHQAGQTSTGASRSRCDRCGLYIPTTGHTCAKADRAPKAPKALRQPKPTMHDLAIARYIEFDVLAQRDANGDKVAVARAAGSLTGATAKVLRAADDCLVSAGLITVVAPRGRGRVATYKIVPHRTDTPFIRFPWATIYPSRDRVSPYAADLHHVTRTIATLLLAADFQSGEVVDWRTGEPLSVGALCARSQQTPASYRRGLEVLTGKPGVRGLTAAGLQNVRSCGWLTITPRAVDAPERRDEQGRPLQMQAPAAITLDWTALPTWNATAPEAENSSQGDTSTAPPLANVVVALPEQRKRKTTAEASHPHAATYGRILAAQNVEDLVHNLERRILDLDQDPPNADAADLPEDIWLQIFALNVQHDPASRSDASRRLLLTAVDWAGLTHLLLDLRAAGWGPVSLATTILRGQKGTSVHSPAGILKHRLNRARDTATPQTGDNGWSPLAHASTLPVAQPQPKRRTFRRGAWDTRNIDYDAMDEAL